MGEPMEQQLDLIPGSSIYCLEYLKQVTYLF